MSVASDRKQTLITTDRIQAFHDNRQKKNTAKTQNVANVLTNKILFNTMIFFSTKHR